MPKSPDDPKKPENPDNPEGGNGGGDGNEPLHGHAGLPPNMQGKQIKVVITPSAQEVKFADIFGYTLSPTHGVIKFGTLQPETGEFIVHTQIAMTPQGIMALSEGLKANIEKARKMSPGKGQTMN